MTPHPHCEIDRAEWIGVTFLVALAVALRLWAIDAKSLWLDEAFSAWVAAHGVVDLVRFTALVDHHPPLYYLLLHFWQSAFGDSARSLRHMSALLGVAAIAPFYFSGRILIGRRAAMLATLLFVVSPFHVRYGQEARMYALMTFSAAMMLWSLSVYLGDSEEKSARRLLAAIVLCVSQAALMWSHNTAVFLAPLAVNSGVLLAWIFSRRRSTVLPALREPSFLRKWWIVQGGAILLWLPWLPIFARQAGDVYSRFWIDPLSPYSVWLVFHNFNLAYPEGWFPGSPWWDIFFWSLAAAGTIRLRRQLPIAALLAALFLVPISTEMFVSIWRPILYDRTLIWTTLPYFLLIGSGLAALSSPGSVYRRGTASQINLGLPAASLGASAAALLLLAALSGYSLRTYYVEYEKEDWAGVAEYVGRNTQEDDLVLFSAAWSEIPFEYATREISVTADMQGVPATLFATGELEPAMTPGDIEGLSLLVSSYDDVWLVYTHEWYADPDGLVPSTLAASHELVGERAFNGPRVLHYERALAGD